MPVAHPAAAQSPAVTTSQAVNAETLKAFVEGAKARIEEINEAKQLLTPFISSLAEEGDWKHGNTYLMLMNEEGIVLFHSDDADAGDKNIYALEDTRGNTVVQDLIAAADADGHIEYYWDDPAQEGDEDTGSPKISYAKSFIARGGREIVVGAGIYTGAATAVEGQSWGQLKSDF